MRTLKLKDFVKFTTISQNSSWEVVYNVVKENVHENEEVEIDMTGIQIHKPCSTSNTFFDKLLEMSNIHFALTSTDKEYLEQIQKSVEMKCILDKYKRNRVRVTAIEVPKKLSKEEMAIEKMAMTLLPMFNTDGDTVMFKYPYSNITGSTSINAISKDIFKIHGDTGKSKFLIDVSNVNIMANAIEAMAKNIVELDKAGIELSFDITNEEYISKLKLFIHSMVNAQKTITDRVQDICNIKVGTAGILIKYKHSNATDDFGRHGKGQAMYSKIAVFRGISEFHGSSRTSEKLEPTLVGGVLRDKNGIEVPLGALTVEFDVYSDSTFLTMEGWLSEFDGEMKLNGKDVNELPHERVRCNIDELGLFSEFLGSCYHFLRPVQRSEGESRVTIVGINDGGYNIKKKLTLPERIKAVFDSWGVEYNKEELNKDIAEVAMTLGVQQ